MVRLIFVPVILAAMVLPLYSAVVEVLPVVETESVAGTGDVADDAAIWIHPVDRELSRVIGHSKDIGGGLHVYNLAGEEVQFVEIGKVGNLDVGYNFPPLQKNLWVSGGCGDGIIGRCGSAGDRGWDNCLR